MDNGSQGTLQNPWQDLNDLKVADAVNFVDGLCESLRLSAKPIVPELPSLRRVLQLSDDVLMVRANDLVRKAMDELAYALHHFILFTMVHSSVDAFLSAEKGHVRKPIRFRVAARWDPEKGKMFNLKRPREISIVVEPINEQRSRYFVLHNIDEYIDSNSKDLRSLLGHVALINTVYGKPWCFWHDGQIVPYYPGDIATVAKALRGTANYFSHRDGFIPFWVPECPSKQFFESIASRDQIVASRFLAKASAWCNLMKQQVQLLVSKLHPDLHTGDLYLNKELWVYGFMRGLLKASYSHFDAVVSIASHYECVAPFLEMHIKGTLSQTESEDLQSILGELKEEIAKDHQLAEASVSVSQDQSTSPALKNGTGISRAIRFNLFMLWPRFGLVTKDGGDSLSEPSAFEANSQSEGSGGSSSMGSRDKDQPDHDSPHEFDLVKCTRFEIVSQTVPQISNRSVVKVVQVKSTFYAEPFGTTHVDIINRILDVTQLALRHILIQIARKYSSKLEKDGCISANFRDESALLQKHIVEEFLTFQVHSSLLEPDEDVYQFLEIDRTVNDVAVLRELREDMGGQRAFYYHFEAFRLFTRRPDVMARIRDGFWSKFDLIPHFVRFEPVFADPRFLATFLHRLKHPITGMYLFPEASDMIDIRDRAMHSFHLVEPTHYQFDELYRDRSRLSLFIQKVAKTLGLEKEKFESLEEVRALDEIAEFIGHYKLWRGRQQRAFGTLQNNMQAPSSSVSTVEMLYQSFDLSSGTLTNPITGQSSEGSAKSLYLLLKLYQHGLPLRPASVPMSPPWRRNPFTALSNPANNDMNDEIIEEFSLDDSDEPPPGDAQSNLQDEVLEGIVSESAAPAALTITSRPNSPDSR